MCTALYAWWGLTLWIITDVLLDVHTLENCGCILSPLLNIPYTHMEVFTSREKLFGGLSHSRPQDRMWDGGEIFFFHTHTKKWRDSCKDQIPCNPIFGISTTDLISVFLGFFGHHLFIHIHRDEKHEKFICFFLITLSLNEIIQQFVYFLLWPCFSSSSLSPPPQLQGISKISLLNRNGRNTAPD